jgi:hypothetical protein
VKSLGTFDAPNLNLIAAGTEVHFSFPTVMNGFGMTIITPDEAGVALFDGDVQLYAPGAGVARLTLSDGVFLEQRGGLDYYGYFIGVVAQTPFNRASLTYAPDVPLVGFSYNADDFLGLPEPGQHLLLLVGIAGLLALGRLRNAGTSLD